MQPHRVIIVVDPEHGEWLEALAGRAHVWAVRSPTNEVAVRRIWASEKGDGGDALASGATIFDPNGSTPGEWCANILATVDEHHGPYSHEPPLSIVEVIGASLSEQLRRELLVEGFSRFEATSEGFIAHRDPGLISKGGDGG